MTNNKGQTIFLAAIGIATLAVAIIGATFAYFSITVQGNENASSITVTTAILGHVQFTDGSEIQMLDINPGYKGGDVATNKIAKIFTIENTSTQPLSSDVNYKIFMNVDTNTISNVANGKEVLPNGNLGETTGNYFQHSLRIIAASMGGNLSSNASGDQIIKASEAKPWRQDNPGEATHEVEAGIETSIIKEGDQYAVTGTSSQSFIPNNITTTGINVQIGTETGKFSAGQSGHKHVYYYTLEFFGSSTFNQNEVQGKSFGGKLQIETV